MKKPIYNLTYIHTLINTFLNYIFTLTYIYYKYILKYHLYLNNCLIKFFFKLLITNYFKKIIIK